MPIESSGEIRLRGAAGDGRTDINEEINSNATDTDVSLGTLNTSAFTNVSDGSTVSGRSMSEMRGFALVTADPFYPTTEATGSLGESLFIPQSSTISYLDRDTDFNSTGNTATYSIWLKRNDITGTNQTIIASGADQNNRVWLRFNTSGSVIDGKLQVVATTSSSTKIQLVYDYPFTDTGAWYHIIVAFDTTKSYQYDRVRVYANGIELTEIDGSVKTEIWPSQNDSLYFNANQRIADVIWSSGIGSDIVFADFKYIDGQQLRPDSFGQIKNGIWVPKAFNTASTDTLVTSNLLANYQLNGNANDETGNYNGSASNVSFISNNYGVGDFNGSNSGITLTNSLFNNDQNHSFSLWINIDDYTSEGQIFFGGETNFRIQTNGKLRYRRWSGSGNDIDSSVIDKNKWYHVVCTFSTTSGMVMYINGISVGTNSYTGSVIAGSARSIGYRSDISGSYFNGQIGEVQIYTKSLSATEVLQNYNATKHYYAYGLNGFHLPLNNTSAGSIDSSSNLQIHLDASQSSSYGGSGTTWSDLTSNGRNATLVNGLNYISSNGGYFDADGSNDYINLNYKIPCSVSFTLEYWFKYDTTTTGGRLLGTVSRDDTCLSLECSPVNGAVAIQCTGASNSVASLGNNGPTDTNWHHWVITRSGSKISYYLDGILKATSTGFSSTATYTSSYDTILMSLRNGYSHMNGSIAQFRYYDDTLTAQEVIQNYRATQGNYEQVSTVDISGNANSFTATNFDYTNHIVDQPAENYVTLNPNAKPPSGTYEYQYGNLRTYSASNNVDFGTTGTIPVTSGKWYFECQFITNNGYSGTTGWLDSKDATVVHSSTYPVNSISNLSNNLQVKINSTTWVNVSNSFAANGVWSPKASIAFDADTGKLWVKKATDTTWYNSGDPAAGTNPVMTLSAADMYVMFACQGGSNRGVWWHVSEDNWDGTAPTGFKAVATHNLPNAQFDPKDSEQNKDYFKAVTYQGNGSTQGEEYGFVDGSKAATGFAYNKYITFPSIPNVISISGNYDSSISIWINLSSLPTGGGFHTLMGRNGTGSNVSELRVLIRDNGSSTVKFELAKGFSGVFWYDSTMSNSFTPTLNQWYNLVITYTASTKSVSYYLNGASYGTGTLVNGGSYTMYSGFNIGSYALNNATYSAFAYFGKVDQFRIFNKALSSSEISDLYDEQDLTATTRSTTDIFSDGSGVALYELNGDALDTGGISGKFGSGAIFNGSSSAINLGATNQFASNGVTVSMWMKPNSVTTTQMLIANSNGGSFADGDFFIGVRSDGYIGYEIGTSSSIYEARHATTTQLSVGSWYHILVTFDSSLGTTIGKIYVNNTLQSTTATYAAGGTFSGNVLVGTLDLQLGKRNISGNELWYNGAIDQVRIFNKAISTNNNGVNEINELYTESGADLSTTDILGDRSGVALYQLDGDATDTGGVSGAIFNGSTSYITLGTGVIPVSSDCSITMWVYRNSGSGRDVLISQFQSSQDNRISIEVDNTTNKISFNGDDVTLRTSTYTVPFNEWVHLAFTLADATDDFKIYANGVEQTTQIDSGTADYTFKNYTTQLGTYNNLQDSRILDGKIDELRIYSDVLTSQEIGYIYNNTTGSIPTDNLQSYYKFNNNAIDEQGNNNATTVNDIIYKYDGTETNVSYAYNGTASNVTYTQDKPYGNINVGFAPDLVWVKKRDGVHDHKIADSVRGATKILESSTNDTELSALGSINSFDLNGFSVGSDSSVNGSGNEFIAWCWKAAGFKNDFNVIENGTLTTSNSNTTAGITAGSKTDGWKVSANRDTGFSIVRVADKTNTVESIGHGLSKVPEIIFSKLYDTAQIWLNYHKETGTNGYLPFSTGTFTGLSGMFSAVGSTTFSTNTAAGTSDMIAYCWHSVDGFSKIGSYIGNGSSNGPFVYTGFKPAFVIVKRTDNSGQNWVIFDNKRDTANPVIKKLAANLSYDENNSSYIGSDTQDNLNFYSNGFKPVTSNNHTNLNGGTFIYMAFAEDPFTTSNGVATLGDGNEFIEGGNYPEDNFNTTLYTGTGAAQDITTGIDADFIWAKTRTYSSITSHRLVDTLRGDKNHLYLPNTLGETFDSAGISINNDGFSFSGNEGANLSGAPTVAWSWKAAGNANTYNILENGTVTSSASASTLGLTNGTITPDAISANRDNGFSIIKYTGAVTGNNKSFSHGLSKPPEIIVIKDIDWSTPDWFAWHKDLSSDTHYLRFNTNAVEAQTSTVYSAAPTNSLINIGNDSGVGDRADRYICYAWHSVPGYSKIGFYNGSGAAGNAQNVGFEPGWILIKRFVGSISQWVIFDNKRPGYALYNDLANNENYDTRVTLTSTGFQFTGSAFNETNTKWIYMAFAHR